MPQVPIVMPQLGESIAEATVIKLLVSPGETVREDQEVMEVETSKATTTVNSPCPGRISKITARMNEAYPVGAELGFIEVDEAVAKQLGISDLPPPSEEEALPRIRLAPEPSPQKVEPT